MVSLKRIEYIISLIVLVFCSASAYSQDPVFTQVRKKFEDHQKTFPQEKLFVHTDKEFYVAGEIIWFKIYALNGSTHKPMDLSKLAYAEIIDAQGKSVLNAKISLSKEGGSGSLYIPLSINSGNFIFRSYTNWMKNFGEEVFFEKKITIINTLKNQPTNIAGEAQAADIAFFPEGGYLIDGVLSRVGFEMSGYDVASPASGYLIANERDTVLRFSPGKSGRGSFEFTPNLNTVYTARLQGKQSIVKSLPAAQAHGYTMRVTDLNDGRLRVMLSAKFPDSYRGTPNLFLLAHSRRQVKVAQQGYLGTNNEFAWVINKNELGEGVNHLTVFNDAGKPVTERLIFHSVKSPSRTSLSLDKAKYKEREEIQLNIQSGPGNNFNGSLSVYQADSLFDVSPGIYNYLMLESELSNMVASLNHLDAGNNQEIENLLLTHGWRKFKWDDIFADSRKARFLPEIDGHLITARVVNTSNGRPAVGVECYLSVPSYPFGFYLAESDSNGIVSFTVRNYFGPGEVIAQVSEAERQKYRVDLLSPFTDRPAHTKISNSLLSFNLNRLLDKSIAMQAQNIYQGDSLKRYRLPSISDTLPFYGKAEFSYNLNDYKRFTTMEEVLREYVMQINVRVQNSGLEMVMFDETTRQFYSDNILVLLDGIPIYDYNKIFSYDPLKIDRLEIIPRRYLYGSRVFSGIASFHSSNEKFDGFTLDPTLLAVDYEGLQLQREFYSPSHNNATKNSKRIPDLRTTLFWEPYVKMNANGTANFNFFSSDMKGKYMVILQGITDDGTVIEGRTGFEVE